MKCLRNYGSYENSNSACMSTRMKWQPSNQVSLWSLHQRFEIIFWLSIWLNLTEADLLLYMLILNKYLTFAWPAYWIHYRTFLQSSSYQLTGLHLREDWQENEDLFLFSCEYIQNCLTHLFHVYLPNGIQRTLKNGQNRTKTFLGKTQVIRKTACGSQFS